MLPLPYQQRVVEEKSDLDEKIQSLTAFIFGSSLYEGLSLSERERQKTQLEAMMRYSTALADRIRNF